MYSGTRNPRFRQSLVQVASVASLHAVHQRRELLLPCSNLWSPEVAVKMHCRSPLACSRTVHSRPQFSESKTRHPSLHWPRAPHRRHIFHWVCTCSFPFSLITFIPLFPFSFFCYKRKETCLSAMEGVTRATPPHYVTLPWLPSVVYILAGSTYLQCK